MSKMSLVSKNGREEKQMQSKNDPPPSGYQPSKGLRRDSQAHGASSFQPYTSTKEKETYKTNKTISQQIQPQTQLMQNPLNHNNVTSLATQQALATAALTNPLLTQNSLWQQQLKLNQNTHSHNSINNTTSNTLHQQQLFQQQLALQQLQGLNTFGLNGLNSLQNNQLTSLDYTNPLLLNQLLQSQASLFTPINSLLNPLLASNLVQPFSNLSAPVNGQPQSLFVFHLPEDVDDTILLQLFIGYGATRANVMRHETGRSRGFGFVHFNSKAEAQLAIDMMNGYQIGKKRLRVSFKKESQKNKEKSIDNGNNSNNNSNDTNN